MLFRLLCIHSTYLCLIQSISTACIFLGCACALERCVNIYHHHYRLYQHHHHFVDSRSIQPLLLIYGTSAATSTLACIATFLSIPIDNSHHVGTSLAKGIPYPNSAMQTMLLAIYMPYLLVPLMMTIDMAQRIGKAMGRAERSEVKKEL